MDLFYDYLLQVEPKNMNIFQALKLAKEYARNKTLQAEKQKLADKQIKSYSDFDVEMGDLF